MTGDASAVQVDVTRSNLGEVLAALEAAFRFRVNTSMTLDKQVTGTYSGSLAQVLSRMLQGHDYFIRRRATGLEVTVVPSQYERAVAAASPRRPRRTPAMSLAEAARLNGR